MTEENKRRREEARVKLEEHFKLFDTFASPLLQSFDAFRDAFAEWMSDHIKLVGDLVEGESPAEIVEEVGSGEDEKLDTTGVLDGEKEDSEEKGQEETASEEKGSDEKSAGGSTGEDILPLPFTDQEFCFADRTQIKEWVEECFQTDENIYDELPDLNETPLPEIKDAIAEFYDFVEDWKFEKRKQKLSQYTEDAGCNLECIKEGVGCIYPPDERDDLDCWPTLTDAEKAITIEVDNKGE